VRTRRLIIPEEELSPLQTRKKTFIVDEGDLEVLSVGRTVVSEDELMPLTEEINHTKLLSILQELGVLLGFIAKIEEYMPDRIYRCDVTWRDYEAHSPIKVFEVELSRNIDHALSSLTHALDVWRPEQLYLVVSDERDLARAEKLVEPRVRGAFARISGRLNILTWVDVVNLYDAIKPHKDLLKHLAIK